MDPDSPLEFSTEIKEFKGILRTKLYLQNVDLVTLSLQYKFGNFGLDAS